MYTQAELPTWITPEQFEELLNKHTQLELCETESLITKGKKLEFFVKPPDDTAYAASMRYITNGKVNSNDVVKMQQTLFDFCFVQADPGLVEEMKDETVRVRHVLGIGQAIGEAFPLPEARLKKSFRKA